MILQNVTTKCYHVITAVDTEILTQVFDIIQTPPDNNKYDTLKTRLVSIYTDSEEKKLRKLLSEVEFGDRQPSTLLNEMQRLGEEALSSELLKSLWLQHLPIAMQSCLAVTSGTVEELSKLADKIGGIGEPRVVAAVASDPTTELLKHLIKDVAEFKIERFHRTLKQTIMTYEKSDWVSILPTILLGLRCALKGESNTTLAKNNGVWSDIALTCRFF